MKTKKVNNKALQVERKKDYSIFEETKAGQTTKKPEQVKEDSLEDNFNYNAF